MGSEEPEAADAARAGGVDEYTLPLPDAAVRHSGWLMKKPMDVRAAHAHQLPRARVRRASDVSGETVMV